jgi:hypothetical protein
LEGEDLKPKFNLKGTAINAMDINHRNQSLCWISTKLEKKPVLAASEGPSLGRMQCASIVNTTDRWMVSFVQRLDYVEQIAFDWIANNWYFVDGVMHRIFLCSEDGISCITIVDQELQNPRGIALDPTKGYLFFANWGAHPKLERADLDGSSRSRLIFHKIVYPRGISLDYANEQVYWTDSYLNHIQRIDYDGKNRISITEGSPVDSILELSVFGNWLYLTDGSKNHVVRIDKHNGTRIEVIRDSVPVRASPNDRPGSIHVYHRQVCFIDSISWKLENSFLSAATINVAADYGFTWLLKIMLPWLNCSE